MAGAIRASSGYIGGWLIEQDKLSSANSYVKLNGSSTESYGEGVTLLQGTWLNSGALRWVNSAGAITDIDTAFDLLSGSTERITHVWPSQDNHGSSYLFALYTDPFDADPNLRNAIQFGNTSTIFNLDGEDVDFTIAATVEQQLFYIDASTDLIYLGGTTNGVRVEGGGNLTLLGTAMQWEDLRVEPVARTTGTNAPTFEKWLDDSAGTSRGVYLYSFDDVAAAAEKEVFFTMQLPHAWAGTAIALHVHWIGNNSDTTATPYWGLEYAWKEIGEVFGDTVIVHGTGNVTPAGTDPDITARKHYLTEFDDITPGSTQDGLSSILIGRLFRNSSATEDTYNVAGNKCGLLYIDAHYEVNSFGSNLEYVK